MLANARKKGYIATNTMETAEQPKVQRTESRREFLTLDEVRRLERTPYGNESVRRAFLFACCCGLRISDIAALRWRDISPNGGRWFVASVMKKTGATIALPLPQKALSWLPQRGGADDTVFDLPRRTNIFVQEWARLAGIDKHVSFHTSRHTFGTLMISAGVDLYTVSKIMGHADVRTTQIYVRIIDSKKIEAVEICSTECSARRRSEQYPQGRVFSACVRKSAREVSAAFSCPITYRRFPAPQEK